MAASMPLRPTAADSSPVRLLVIDEHNPPMSLLPPPTVLLLSGWQVALEGGRSAVAAGYRRLVDAIADEEPTWEDAEWQ